MISKEYLEKFLSIDQPMEGSPIRFSTLALLLRGARKMAGRNIENGTYESKELNEENLLEQTYHSFQFTSLINYLIFLEQVGSIFKPKNKNAPTGKGKENGIYRALSYYSNLGEDKKRSVIALRNSLTHKFGLATEAKPHSGFPVRFSLSIVRNEKIVEVPTDEKRWEGDFSNKSEASLTTIYILDLLDLIEEIYLKIISGIKNENIQVLIDLNELKGRYTITN